MDVLLIIIWILILVGWYLYKKAQKIYAELESYGIPYEGAIKAYSTMIELFLMRRHFVYIIADQYNRFKGQQ